MPLRSIHHVVVAVPDLASAEAAYCDVFDLDVLFREGTYDDEFGALPEGLDWGAATTAGVEPGMSFLGRNDVAIAIVERDDGTASDGDAETGDRSATAAVLDHVALHVDEADVAAIAGRARERGWEVDERDAAAFLDDDAGIEWEVNASDPPPATPFDELDVDPA